MESSVDDYLEPKEDEDYYDGYDIEQPGQEDEYEVRNNLIEKPPNDKKYCWYESYDDSARVRGKDIN